MTILITYSRSVKVVITFLLIVILLGGLLFWQPWVTKPVYAYDSNILELNDQFIYWNDPILTEADMEPYYADVLDNWREQGTQATTEVVKIPAAIPHLQSDEQVIHDGSYEDRDDVLIWESTDTHWVEYEFDVEIDGLYQINVTYHPLMGKGYTRPIVWDVTVDGKRPFREASSITLYREWRDALPVQVNEDGDEIRPTSIDISTWRTKPFIDSGANYISPLQWHFTKGKHRLRLVGYEPVAIEEIQLVPPQTVKTYSQVASTYPSTKPVEAEVITVQAENMLLKNDASIQMFYDRDQRTVPLATGRIKFNTVGGFRWDWPNQEITWSLDVPETGLYKIALRTLQNQFSQKASFRTIKIDGEVPFEEFLAYRFPYESSWVGTILSDSSGNEYELYLEEGNHTFSMELTHSTVSPIVRGIENVSGLLRGIYQDLQSLTGGQLDSNRTWKIERDLPDLRERLEIVANNLTVLSDQMREVNGTEDTTSEGFRSSASDIRDLIKHIDELPYYIDELLSTDEKMNNFIVNLHKQSLMLDEIYVAPVEKNFPQMVASLAGKVYGLLANFVYSFDTRDSIGDMDSRELNVWVQRGRDYVTQLQELSDEMFTPATGIKVKVNLLPNPQLLVMSNAAGLQPDIALGISQDLPVDYAIRGSVYDLTSFPDFDEIYKLYSPGSWLPMYYDKGYYAVPETQSFQVLYYRKDILRQLDIEVPNTWEEVFDLLPTLQQNFMNFYVNPQEFIPYMYQNNVDFYEPNGFKTALDHPEGFKAFKQWTDLFNTYALEQEVPSFYQHFRNGTMPMGVSDYNMYVQLSAAAPELNGRWGIALIPGTKQEDGTISRWAGGDQTTGVIFEASEKKVEAWEYLKWWTSTEVQERYGADLESINGVSFRWNTSNIEAFTRLPWKKEDANIIIQQWSWYKEKPNPPGGYYLGRELRNAWVRSVVDGMNYRASLETAIMDINRELNRKQQEFGFVDVNGQILKSLDLPIVNEPWKGTEAYVK